MIVVQAPGHPIGLKKKIRVLEASACVVLLISGFSWLLGIFGVCLFVLGILPFLILINVIRQKRDLYHMTYGQSLEISNATIALGLSALGVNAVSLTVGLVLLSGA